MNFIYSMTNSTTGQIHKMISVHSNPIEYSLPIGNEKIAMNPLIGKKISLEFAGEISCIHCDRKIKKTFGQGYCFPCFQSLARCDMCIMRPELCHYAMGTCREPEWGESNCLIPHTIYLANSSGAKVGITRSHQEKTRWIDQGALFALPIGRVKSRLDSGLVEAALKQHISDKTNWRKMLKNEVPDIDLLEIKKGLLEHWPKELTEFIIQEEDLHSFSYPVEAYPTKVVSHNLEKKNLLEGTLTGIKGQYLILDTAVINMRKYTGYELTLSSR